MVTISADSMAPQRNATHLHETKLKAKRLARVPANLAHRLDPASESMPPAGLDILILIVGSRGDVQPFLALGKALKEDGHNVRLGTHEVFRSFVGEAGLGFHPIGGDPAELMAYMTKNPGLVPSMQSIASGDISRKRKTIKEILDGCWAACVSANPDGSPFQANAIISNPVTFAHVHCAEKLGVPLHIFFTMPWSPTRAFPHPLANLKADPSPAAAAKGKMRNRLSYYAVQQLTWTGLLDLVNSFRKSTLELDPIASSSGGGANLLAELRTPHTYCWSPSLVAKPADWGDHIDVCGFFFLDLATDYQPPNDLAEFLAAGPPPVYIGFGSIVVEDPAKLLKTVLDGVAKAQEAAAAAGRPEVRAIVSAGWGGLTADSAPPGVLFLGNCPHDWLFQHVAAVVCHGGAGTTAAALRLGKPVFVVPFFGDQPFWGASVARAGAGPAPVHHKRLNADNLAEGISFCLVPETAAACAKLSQGMAGEDGVREGVRSFYRHLPRAMMRCDVRPELKAEVFLAKPGLKLSKQGLQELVAAGVIKQKWAANAKPWASFTHPVQRLCAPADPITGFVRGCGRGAMRAAEGCSDVVLDPVRAWRGKVGGMRFVAASGGVVTGTCRGLGKSLEGCLIPVESLSTGLWNFGKPRRKYELFAPDSFAEGLLQGCVMSIKAPVVGAIEVFTLPVQGARSAGVVGAGSGLFYGLSGLVGNLFAGPAFLLCLPVSGARRGLDRRNKTTVCAPRATTHT